MKKISMCCMVLCLALCILTIEQQLFTYAGLALVTDSYVESDSFRRMQVEEDAIVCLKEKSRKAGYDWLPLLTAAMIAQHNCVKAQTIKQVSANDLYKNYQFYKKYKADEIEEIDRVLRAIWEDAMYFPVPVSSGNEDADISFENSWQHERTYGGKRGHEGTDIMAGIHKRGYYPIVSVSDGVVENIGWLPQGGYRIGIRSENGAYFYYAHLYSYARQFQEGEKILKGEFLGFMGDTGYSEIEGTVGNFDVHLHFGIYIKTKNMEEMSLNSYYLLKYLQSAVLTYRY